MSDEELELNILIAIVEDALAANYFVSVFDGEEWALKKSTDKSEILAATRATDEDQLRFRTSDGTIIGSVWLIYGNGCDVVSDHTDNPEIRKLLERANRIAEGWCPPPVKHRHVKRGSTYLEVSRAPLQKSGDYVLKEGDVLVTYRSLVDGQIYHRFEPEFDDGRFVKR